MGEQALIPEVVDENEERLPSIVSVAVQPSKELAEWAAKKQSAIVPLCKEAEELEVDSEEAKERAKEIRKTLRVISAEVTARISPIKKELDGYKQQALKFERFFTDQCERASETTLRKLNARLEYEDNLRKKEEQRLRELAEQDRKKRMDALDKRLQKLLDQADGLAEQRKALEAELQKETITMEESDAIRARINAIDTKLSHINNTVDDKQAAMEEVATPVVVSVPQEKTKGIISRIVYKVDRIVNIFALLKAIIMGKVPVSVIKVLNTELERVANAQVKGTDMQPDIPGVAFRAERDTRTR